MKRPVLHSNIADYMRLYMSCLMPEPFQMLQEEFIFDESIQIRKHDQDKCSVRDGNQCLLVTENQCECSFQKSTGLPCRHIYVVRKIFDRPLFSEELCEQRWKKSFVLQNLPRLASQSSENVNYSLLDPVNTKSAKKD